jgi:hypothetical protein
MRCAKTSFLAAVVSLLFCVSLATISDGSDRDAYWVFFADKGTTDERELNAEIRSLADSYPARTLQRRAKVRGEQVVGWEDLPVHEEYVRSVVSRGAELRARSRWLNAISVWATPEVAISIGRLPFVQSTRQIPRKQELQRFVEPHTRAVKQSPLLQQSDYGYSESQLAQIQVPDLHAAGFRGEGVLIAMLDTGYLLDHVAFDSIDVVAQWDFVQGDSVVENQTGDDPYQHNHGTKTLATIAGNEPGSYLGAAYKASFLLAKTEILDQEVPLEEDYWVAGLEWVDSAGADIVNSSLMYINWYDYSDMDGETAVTTIAADQAVLNGLVICNAAGNEGGSAWKYIGAPADGDEVIAVGAVDAAGNRVGFSSQGPTFDGRIKPDLCARGSGVYTVVVSQQTGYATGGGTSFASPLTAGACALILQAHPDWAPWQLRHALRATATQAANPDTFVGWGIVQAFDAYQAPTSVPPAVATVGTRLRLSAVPNPSNYEMKIEFLNHSPLLAGLGLPLEVQVFDVRGRLVSTLYQEPASFTNRKSLTWNGTDDRGRLLPSGVYFVRASAGHDSVVRKVVLLR